MPLFESVPPSAWNEGVAFWPTVTVAPAGLATVVTLFAEASATASCCAWRVPDVRIDSPANTADALPSEATRANTRNRFMPFLLTVFNVGGGSSDPPLPRVSSELQRRRHARQARVQERRWPRPPVARGRVRRGHVLDRVAVQRVVKIEREPQAAPSDVQRFADREIELVEPVAVERPRRDQV